ncbi:DEAD/DEAH box helicase [Aeromicrobium phragmitis]|uniref:DEAD/DEAH box helicase n=1 Tax=Aeromicrobium phragmitis TaxID=2478914 RepID=A0A3L8PQ83_9ACTN|nr:DEAD/DEAH box helicase [Aeromicrobium phragmitis]RLV57521.1 DEAD/DEAH box helicase [Aeromicrobium phragmitis]
MDTVAPSLLERRADRILHRVDEPAREAVVEPWPSWIGQPVRDHFAAEGAEVLWAHQSEALRRLERGENVVVATGTASGKSLVFTAPALQVLSEGRAGRALDGHQHPTVLYLSPTKALAADQCRRLPTDWPGLRAATVDGDNSREARAWARDHATYVLTNPDTLHHTLLPGHARWARFWSGLTYVVIDECHHYRGVFGAHVAQVLRRLRRVCAHYGATPQFVASSATVSEPDIAAGRLTGLEMSAVTDDASPRGPRTTVFWEPPLLPGRGDGPGTTRRSATTEAAEVVTDLVVDDTRTLCFVRSRRGAEQLATVAQERLEDIDPGLRERVATYRGGYLPEERRELEDRLRSGDLLALASTNALELGIDVAGLDAVVSVGFPGTRAGLVQQFGRAGRGGVDHASLNVLVARDEPIDTYLVHHPEAVLGAPVEATVFDPDNPYVLGPHLAAAAQELPLIESDLELFGERAADGVAALEAAGMLRRRAAGWFWTSRERASQLADLRSAGGTPVQIVDADTGRLVGTVDAAAADGEVHEGAVYVHQGDMFTVEEYDLEHGIAVVRRGDVPYTTSARSSTAVAICDVRDERSHGPAHLSFGEVEVTHQVTSYAKRDRQSGRVLGEEPVELPERTLPTTAVWWTLDDAAVAEVLEPEQIPGAAHAAEHAAIGLLPLLATCDRWDLGGLSTALHPQTGQLTVFVYDGHPGGAGFAERGFAIAARWLSVTRDAIAACECRDGCPSCVVSPKCGNGNQPLDKAGAIRLLDALTRHLTAPDN